MKNALPTVRECSIAKENISINEKNLFRLLGFDNKENDPFTVEMVHDYIEICLKSYFSPAAACLIRSDIDLDHDHHKLYLKKSNIEFETGPMITRLLKDSSLCAFFIATAGKAMEEYSEELMRSDRYLEAYIVDLIGSEAANNVALEVFQQMKKYGESEGLKVTNLYSPGYCEWDVKEQHKLFSLFPDRICGIYLNQSALMSPVKSVSGLIGLGEDAKYYKYNCSFCNRKECIYREIRKEL